MEVKLLKARSKRQRLEVDNDLGKLLEFKGLYSSASAYLLIVGRQSDINRTYLQLRKRRIDLQAFSPVIADIAKCGMGLGNGGKPIFIPR